MKTINALILPLLAVFHLLACPASAAAPPHFEPDTIIGWVPALATSNTGDGSFIAQSDLGSAVADAAIYATGAQLAVMCGGDLAGNLRAGERTYEELCFVFTKDPQLVCAQVTPAQLKQLLEFCLSHIRIEPDTKRIDRDASVFAAFPQLGGCSMEYDASAPIGERVRWIKLNSGEKLDWSDNTCYELVCPEALLSGEYGETGLRITPIQTGWTACQAMAQFISDGVMGQYVNVERIYVVGSMESLLIESYGLSALLPIAAVIILVSFCSRRTTLKERKQSSLF